MAAVYAARKQGVLKETIQQYGPHTDCLELFFRNFRDPKCDGPHGQHKYLNELQNIANEVSSSFSVEVDDLKKHIGDDQEHSTKGKGLVHGVLTNTKRYIHLMYIAAEKVKNEYTPGTTAVAHIESTTTAAMERAGVPIHLRVFYNVYVIPPTSEKPVAARFLNASQVGCLSKIEAVVSRIHPVKPLMQVATYKCEDCGADVFQAVDGPTYMPLGECSADTCRRNKAKGALHLMLRECRLIKHQEAKVQEPCNLVPPGSIPRNIKIVLQGDLTRRITPGVSLSLGGVLLPVVKSGFAALRAGLVADTYFEVHSIEVHKKGYNDDFNLNTEELEKFERLSASQDLYQKLSSSIAPSISGHEDVKKALLLQLVGGTTGTFGDGMKIRGDIHILLMGDPGMAKSQMLRQICKIAPRSHYTTGKGSSGVGLTASVCKDPVTGEFALEGGAIVLADNGICCIDEFDKMDESDRSAIHEVMEQQTVSISKAGLTTTLNARTCILAAANPTYGRYDIRKSAVANMNLPAALLSRFDLQFLLLDRPDLEKDLELAKHVLAVHQVKSTPKEGKEEDATYFNAIIMRMFIAKARLYKPTIPEEIIPEIVDHYVELRESERKDRDRNEAKGYTTPRTLLAILRMSQALARLRRSHIVHRVDYEEALRLMQSSKESIEMPADDHRKQRQNHSDFRSTIMDYIRDLDLKYAHRKNWMGWLAYKKDILDEIVMKMGYSEAQVKLTVDEYVDLDVLTWKSDTDSQHSSLAFVDRLETIGAGNSQDENEDV